jgi:hypothetical protein
MDVPTPISDRLEDVLKGDLQVRFSNSYGTTVFAVAINKRRSMNHVLYIPCTNGTSLCDGVYDNVRDLFCVVGSAWYEVGLIPISCSLGMVGVKNWSIDVPLPYSVFEKHMSSAQKEEFDAWKSNFDSQNYKIEFLQIHSVF